MIDSVLNKIKELEKERSDLNIIPSYALFLDLLKEFDSNEKKRSSWNNKRINKTKNNNLGTYYKRYIF